MDTMSKTTWLGVLDDAKFPVATTEFLLQLQGGFSQAFFHKLGEKGSPWKFIVNFKRGCS